MSNGEKLKNRLNKIVSDSSIRGKTAKELKEARSRSVKSKHLALGNPGQRKSSVVYDVAKKERNITSGDGKKITRKQIDKTADRIKKVNQTPKPLDTKAAKTLGRLAKIAGRATGVGTAAMVVKEISDRTQHLNPKNPQTPKTPIAEAAKKAQENQKKDK